MTYTCQTLSYVIFDLLDSLWRSLCSILLVIVKTNSVQKKETLNEMTDSKHFSLLQRAFKKFPPIPRSSAENVKITGPVNRMA